MLTDALFYDFLIMFVDDSLPPKNKKTNIDNIRLNGYRYQAVLGVLSLYTRAMPEKI